MASQFAAVNAFLIAPSLRLLLYFGLSSNEILTLASREHWKSALYVCAIDYGHVLSVLYLLLSLRGPWGVPPGGRACLRTAHSWGLWRPNLTQCPNVEIRQIFWQPYVCNWHVSSVSPFLTPLIESVPCLARIYHTWCSMFSPCLLYHCMICGIDLWDKHQIRSELVSICVNSAMAIALWSALMHCGAEHPGMNLLLLSFLVGRIRSNLNSSIKHPTCNNLVIIWSARHQWWNFVSLLTYPLITCCIDELPVSLIDWYLKEKW